MESAKQIIGIAGAYLAGVGTTFVLLPLILSFTLTPMGRMYPWLNSLTTNLAAVGGVLILAGAVASAIAFQTAPGRIGLSIVGVDILLGMLALFILYRAYASL